MREWLSFLKLSSLATGMVAMLCVLLLPLVGKAEERPPDPQIPDVRLLFDVSSAADAADPGQVRADAVSLLLRMLPDDGQGGIWVFGDKVSRLVEHGRTDLFWKRLATIHTRSLESRGDKADLTRALAAAAWDADRSSEFQRHIIIVGSGRLETGDSQADGKDRDRLLNETARKLSAAGIRVHAVVLPGESDTGPLRPLTERTNGLYIKVRSVAELDHAFETLLHRTAMPPMLPVKDGVFTVDPGLPEMTLWRSGDEPDIELVDPTGKSHTRAEPGISVRWHDARGHDMLTIEHPVPGRWHFKGEGRARVFAFGDLALRAENVPATLFPGHLNHVDFMLFSGGEAVTDEAFLAMTESDAGLVGGSERVALFVERQAGGVFRVGLTDEVNDGKWMLEITLSGPTFARKLSIPFVLANPVRVTVRQMDKDLVAFAELTDVSVDYGSLHAAAQVRRPPGPRQLFSANPFPGGLWQIRVPDAQGSIEIALSLYGRYPNQAPFELHTEALKVVAPLGESKTFRFDAKGKALEDRVPGGPEVHELNKVASGGATTPGHHDGKFIIPGIDVAPEISAEPLLPLWFSAAVSVLNFLVAVGLGWFVSRRHIPAELQSWLEDRKPAEA